MEDVSLPTKCQFEPPISKSGAEAEEVIRIVAGGNHTLILYKDGSIYAAGCDDDGRCGGDGSSSDMVLRFRRVTVNDPNHGERVIDTFRGVSATWEGTFLVADLGGEGDRMFVLGSGGKGELGLGEGKVKVGHGESGRIPDFPPAGTRIVSIASGMGHTVVVLSNGDVYGWGGARKGQVGRAAQEKKIAWAPVKVGDVPFYATDAVCGREFTIIMGDKSAGEFAILGSSDNKWKIQSDTPAPGVLLSSGYASIATSWHGVYVHQNDSSVVAWGRNDRGQLPPADLPKTKKLAVGSEHALALLDDKTVVAFGWGEHGNCGPDTDAQGNVKETYSHVPLAAEERAEVIGIGAGCATSWIITS
ncbi:hypothetical protein MW887_000307 [Aspergillus wentii]|nr:hypothetical protein MW887_000307 [Aspergillus wentii]